MRNRFTLFVNAEQFYVDYKVDLRMNRMKTAGWQETVETSRALIPNPGIQTFSQLTY